jgi:hypothetical protein
VTSDIRSINKTIYNTLSSLRKISISVIYYLLSIFRERYLASVTKILSIASFKKILIPSGAAIQASFFLIGIILITAGIFYNAAAQTTYSRVAIYNDHRIAETVDILMAYINGAFGAMIMVIAGIAAIMSCAFGQYKAALGLLAVAVGSFVLRTLIATWFNDVSLQNNSIRPQ